jgi:hypothetical protein
MVMGAVWFDFDKKQEIFNRINSIKQKYNISKFRELKWTKVSNSLIDCYIELINYFFDDDDLHYRALIIDNKNKFSHNMTESYDEWYYKMYFHALHNIISPNDIYNIYIDIKDTCSRNKLHTLHDVICTSVYDFNHSHIQKIQAIRSEQLPIMQIVDILNGAISYNSRKLETSNSKLEIIKLLKSRSGYNLDKSTLLRESKFNLFHLQLEEK